MKSIITRRENPRFESLSTTVVSSLMRAKGDAFPDLASEAQAPGERGYSDAFELAKK